MFSDRSLSEVQTYRTVGGRYRYKYNRYPPHAVTALPYTGYLCAPRSVVLYSALLALGALSPIEQYRMPFVYYPLYSGYTDLFQPGRPRYSSA